MDKDSIFKWLGIGIGAVTGFVGTNKVIGYLGGKRNEVVRSNYDWATIDGGWNTQEDGVYPAEYPIQELQSEGFSKTKNESAWLRADKIVSKIKWETLYGEAQDLGFYVEGEDPEDVREMMVQYIADRIDEGDDVSRWEKMSGQRMYWTDKK